MSKAMPGKIIYADSITNPDMLYASRFVTNDPFIYFESNRKKYIVVSPLELERAKKESKKGLHVINKDDLLLTSENKSIKSIFMEMLAQYPQDIWLIPSTFPVGYAQLLKTLSCEDSIVIEENEFFPGRSIKTQQEIKEISKAQAIAEKAVLKAETILTDSSINSKNELVYNKKPLTSEFLKSQINIELAKHGANTHGTIASSGTQCSVPHDTGSGIIQSSVPIIIDVFPRLEFSGYWGDITRTFVKGKVSKIVQKAYDAVKFARDNAISKIKPGIIPSHIHNEAIEYLSKTGFKTGRSNDGRYYGFFHGLGHGVGLEIHENPRINGLSFTPLEAGNVITIEPGVYYPEWGGVRLEDLIVVTKSGYRNLTTYPSILELD